MRTFVFRGSVSPFPAKKVPRGNRFNLLKRDLMFLAGVNRGSQQ